jgi:hypothetical protein
MNNVVANHDPGIRVLRVYADGRSADLPVTAWAVQSKGKFDDPSFTTPLTFTPE